MNRNCKKKVQVRKNLGRVKVTINKKGHIPQLGLGPIRRPILITEELCNHLIKLGYPVKVIKSTSVIKKIEKQDKVVTDSVTKEDTTSKQHEEVKQESEEIVVTENTVEVQEEPAVSEVVEEQPVIETEEEKVIVTEEETEEIMMNDPDLSAEAYYSEDFLSSKALCKKILSNRKVQYEDSASFNLLKKLVSDTNPEVEIIEE